MKEWLKRTDTFTYEDLYLITKEWIIECLESHKKWPNNGYNDMASGALTLFHRIALRKHDIISEQVENDTAALRKIIHPS